MKSPPNSLQNDAFATEARASTALHLVHSLAEIHLPVMQFPAQAAQLRIDIETCARLADFLDIAVRMLSALVPYSHLDSCRHNHH